MPRLLSPALLAEKNRLESDHPWIFLIQLQIEGAAFPLRVANYDQDVVFHGLLFNRFRFEVEALEDATSMGLVHLRVTTTNADQQIQSLLENYWGLTGDPHWYVTIWTCDATQPDQVLFENGEVFTVEKVVTDFVTASFDLVAEGLTLSMTLPKRRYVASSGFPSIPRRV